MSFIILWSIYLSSSLVHFKNFIIILLISEFFNPPLADGFRMTASLLKSLVQSAGAKEYTNCSSAEEQDPA